MPETHKTTVADLEKQVTEIFVKELQDRDSRSRNGLKGLIPAELAKKRHALANARNFDNDDDCIEYGRERLTRDVLKELTNTGLCEMEGPEDKEEVWLVPGAIDTAKEAAPTASTKSKKSDTKPSPSTTQRNTQNGGKNIPVATKPKTAPPATSKPPAQTSTAEAVSTSTRVKPGKTHSLAAAANNECPTDRDQDNGRKQPQEPIEKTVSIKQIHADPALQLRVNQDPTLVEEYAEQMEHRKFPPMLVVFDGTVYWLVDGFYRLAALQMREADTVTVLVIYGTRDDALWLAFSANKDHGLPRTHADKRHAVEEALKHPRAKDLSDNEIAEHVGVTGPTVGNYRKRLQNFCSQPAHRTGRDGRTINTSNIGKGKRRAGQQQRPTSKVLATAEVPAANSPKDKRTMSPAVGTAGHETVAAITTDGDAKGTDNETGAQSSTSCGSVTQQQSGGPKGNGVQDTKSEGGAGQQQKADEAENFKRFLQMFGELDDYWQLHEDAIEAQARMLDPKDRNRQQKRLDNVTDRMKKLRKVLNGVKPARA